MIDEQTRKIARSRIRTFAAALALAEKRGHPVDAQFMESMFAGIERSYLEDGPLGGLIESADLILHAEGPGAMHGSPRLAALNWLSGTSERIIKGLSSAWLTIKGGDGKRLSKHLDLRLAGMAPGSLWMGFRIEQSPADLLPEDCTLMGALADRIGLLPEAARFVDDEALRPGIVEAFPDPAERDVLLESLMKLSPTGNAGIHTLGISSRGHGQSSLTNRERVVLRDALRRPVEKTLREAAFVGEVRAADLDKTRVTLRTADHVIRCALPEMSTRQAKDMIGATVKAAGRIACDKDGRPRLLYVERIDPVAEQQTL